MMKPDEVTSVVLVEDKNSSSSSFLLQGAVHYAEQGYSVCVISMSKVQSLPPPIHGVVMPGADVFSLIRFVYLSRWQDLLQHLYSVHIHAQVPSVIVLQSLEKFFVSKTTTTGKLDIDDQHAALLCASLINAAAVCAARLKKRAHLLVSLKISSHVETIYNTLLNTFFTDFVWHMTTEPAQDNDSEDKVTLTFHKKKRVLTFSQPKDMALYLREVIDSSM